MKGVAFLTSNAPQMLSQPARCGNVDSKHTQAIRARGRRVLTRSIGEKGNKAPVGREEVVPNLESSFWTSLDDISLKKWPRRSPSRRQGREESTRADRQHVAARSSLGLSQLRCMWVPELSRMARGAAKK